MSDANVNLAINGVARTSRAFSDTTRRMRGFRRDMGGMNSSVLRNRRVIQQAGMQMSDFAVQVGGGQSAILALTQNLPQLIQGFGAFGGVMAAVVTIGGTLALIMQRTGTSIAQITPLAGILEDEFTGLANAMTVVKNFAIDMGNVLVNNLDRVFVFAAVFAGLMAGRWVVSMVRAAGVVGVLSGALVTLRAILRTFARLAIFVAIAELVFMFVALVKQTGSVGDAFKALGPISEAVGRAIGNAFKAAGELMRSGMLAGVSAVLRALGDLDNFLVGMIRGSLKGLARVVAFLDKDLDFADLSAKLDSVNTSFTGAARLADEYGDAASNAARSSSFFLGRAQSAVGDVTTEWQKLRDIVNSGGTDIDIRDWFNGVKEGAEGASGAVEKVKTQADKLADAFKSGFDRLFDSIFEGADAAIKALQSLGKEILKIIARQSFFKALGGAFPGLFGGGGMFDLTANANGNVMRGGAVQKFASGGVVSSPTTFPMRNGTGLMGEAGPEAIMPLTRRNGRLGVQASGGGSAPANIQIVNQAPGVQIDYEPTDMGGVTQHRFVAREVSRAIRSGDADSAFAGRFGARPAGAKR